MSGLGSLFGPRATPRVTEEEEAAVEEAARAALRANPWTPTLRRPKVIRSGNNIFTRPNRMSSPPVGVRGPELTSSTTSAGPRSAASEAEKAVVADNYEGKLVPIVYDSTTGLLTLATGLGLEKAPQATNITQLDNLLLQSARGRAEQNILQQGLLARNQTTRVRKLEEARTRNTTERVAREAAAATAKAAASAAKAASLAAAKAERNARDAEVTLEAREKVILLPDRDLLQALKGLSMVRLTESNNSALLRKVVINDSEGANHVFTKPGILSYILTTAKNSNQRQLLIEACNKHASLLDILRDRGLVTAATCQELNTEGLRRGGTRAKKQKRNCKTKRRHH